MTERRRYPGRPVAGVGAVVCAADGRIVLVKRRDAPHENRWSLPGGALEVGETLQQGIAREVREETTLIVDVGPIVHVCDRIVHDAEGRIEFHYVLVDFVCWPVEGTLAASTDALDVAYADPARLDEFDLGDEAGMVVQRAVLVPRPCR